ncbi:MAG: glycine cleavage system protein GcvH [Kineosporiaceae bacterium]|nr:glycine cleavage system protein GcvH [Aeromicrobium sp.]
MIPEDLYYSQEHEWVRIDDDIATIGITDFAQDALGDIVYVDLPAVGDTIDAGSVIGELESTKSVSEIFAPIAGEIVARNDALDAGPEVVNSDPYGEGWLIKVRPSDENPVEGLLESEAYAAMIST